MLDKFEKGFTLIEAMLTMVIVSIGLLAMASLLGTAIKVNATNEMKLEASSVAQSTMRHVVDQVRWNDGLTNADVYSSVMKMVCPDVDILGNNICTHFAPDVVLTRKNPTPGVNPYTFPNTKNCEYTSISVRIGWTPKVFGNGNSISSVGLRSGAMTNIGGC